MLVLSRKRGEQIVVPECGLTLTVLDIVGGRVRVGIAAPANLTIHRAEIVERQRRKSLAPQDK
jgi:carbon storage regulator